MSHAAGGSHTGSGSGSDRSSRSPELSPITEAAEDKQQVTESPSSNTESSPGSGLFIHASASLPAKQSAAETQADQGASSPSSAKQRPNLRLAMLNAQQKAQVQRRGEQHPATAPVRSLPPELPSSGYFAPRGPLNRSQTSQSPGQAFNEKRGGKKRPGRGHPALRFASRDSVHTLDSQRTSEQIVPAALGATATGASATPPGLRRRLTRATNNLVQLGRALNPVATGPLDSGSETEPESGRTSPEENLERLLDQHAANTASRPPTNNIAANNAEIASYKDLYPVNPSTANPGVVHVSMSGHAAAKNIVDSMLGAIGSSTKHEKPDDSVRSPADLEAGLGRAGMPPGLTASPTSLRGVYANLSKLQSRMAEHHEKREQRLKELRQRQAKEEARRVRDEERRRRRQQRWQADQTDSDARATRWNPLDRLADRRTAGRTAGTRTQPSSDTETGEPFVLHSFRSAPRPESLVQMAETLQQSHVRSPTSSPSAQPSPMHSPVHSLATTPGWEELLATSGMLTGGSLPGNSGSRLSTLSMDSTQQAFEAERQKIMAQLADIFNRQNFLL
ncbi:hypothetical protein LPJ73_001585, partial [Coemansia sp. RSA 2703]